MPRCSAILAARSGFERPEKSMSFPAEPACVHGRSGAGCTGSTVSSPGIGRASSVVPVSTTVVLLVDLLRSGDGERSRRDVFSDRGSGCDPSMVPNLHGRNEDIVAAGVDIAADHGSLLLVVLLGPVVGRDRTGADVRALADVRIADVGEVRNLDPFAERRVLDLHEGAHLRLGADDRAGPEVGEGADDRSGTDLRIDDDRVGTD